MQELLEFLQPTHYKATLIAIGQFLGKYEFKNKQGILMNIDEINRFNRFSLVEQFICSKTHNREYLFTGYYPPLRDYEEFELENDLAELIDLKIPFHYFRRLNGYDNDTGKKLYKGIEQIHGLKFQYNENYRREEEMIKAINKFKNKV